MKFFHTLFLTGILSFVAEMVFSQRGFIKTDSVYRNVQIVPQSDIQNSKEVKYIKKPGNEIITLFPEDLVEYGFTKGDTYSTIRVRDVDSTRLYFARRLTNGDKLKLFMIRTQDGDRMFVMNEKELVELHNDSSFYTTLSTSLNTCDQPPAWTRDVKFGSKSLTRAFWLHTSCYNGIFPRLRKGILVGYSFSHLTVTGPQWETVSMGGNFSPFVGIFIDVPLGLMKATWSISVQAYFQKSSFHVSNNTPSHVQEYISNTSFVNVPILFKYHWPAANIGKYIGFGMAPSYYFNSENYKYDTVTSGSEVTVTKTNYNSINQFQISGALGAGLNIKVMDRNILTLELQYSFGRGIDIGGDFKHSLSAVQLISSISF